MKTEIKITNDIKTAYILTRELMKYHNALDIFTMTEERFRELIETGVLISFTAYVDGQPAGVMNIFYKYTTFSGKKILYIEDLYVCESFRGCGTGGKFLAKAKEIAILNNCEQIELKCAEWNEKSAGFYSSHGMTRETEWNVYTLKVKK